jgi:branched-chain amino acid transport system substrate-binding protein
VRATVHIALTALLALVASAGSGVGETLDDIPEVVTLYARGERLMREGDFLAASRIFEELAGRFPNSPNIDLIIFNRAKAAYYFGEYDKALAGFDNFSVRFPNSPHWAHARFFHGNANYIKNNQSAALRDYLQAFGASNDRRLDDLIVASIEQAVATARTVSLGMADFEGLPGSKRCGLVRRVVQVLVDRRQTDLARRLMTACGLDIALPDAGDNDELLIGMVLPFSGELQSYGEEIYNGAVIAADMCRGQTGRKISLESFDTRGDPVSAARIIRELAYQPHDVVVGPLTSEASAVASAVLSCTDLPMIAPAATQAGLTQLSPHSFQLTPNVELQGVQMAEYARVNLMADSAAIITSTAPEYLRMSKAFADRFVQLGGTVAAIEYYRARDRDFSDYINDIKAILLGVHPDSTYFIDDEGDTLDTDGVPAHIDCLFLPGRAVQLKQLLPQIRFYNLQADYLGSDDWGDDAVRKLGEDITRRAVFPSPTLEQARSEEYLAFAAAYDNRYGKEPPRLAALGFDAVRLITRTVMGGGGDRARLTEALTKVADHIGAAGRVTFGIYRENTAMPVYRLEGEEAVFLGVGQIEDSGSVTAP